MKRPAHSAVVCSARARDCRQRSIVSSDNTVSSDSIVSSGIIVSSGSIVSSMSPRGTCRSIAISLAIVILLIASPANGFTIHRNQESTEAETVADLAVAESTLLEVKNDLNRPNDIKASKISKHEGSEKTQTTDSFKNKFTTDDSNTKFKQTDKGEKSRERTFKHMPEITTHYSKGNPNIHITILDFKTSSDVLTGDVNNESGSKTLESTKNPELSSLALNSAELNKIISTIPSKDITKTDSSYTTTQLTSVSTRNNANNRENDELTTAFVNSDYNSQGTTIFSNYNLGAEVNTLQDSTSLDDTSYNIENDTISNQTFLSDVSTNPNKLEQNSSNVTNASTETTTNISEDEIKSTLDIALTTAIATEELTKTINELSTTIDNTSGIIDLIPVMNSESNVTTETNIPSENNTNVKNSFITTDQPIITTTEPSWRKYTIIERKRVTTPELTTFTGMDEVPKAETAPTRISLEEALAVTPIASLERLREDLIANRNKLAAIQELSHSTKLTSTSELKSTPVVSTLKLKEAKVGMVSSMRAGFLDYSGKASTSEISTTEDTEATSVTSYGREDGGTDRLNNKYVESQSQLAEDAIKEELMKEEMLNDNLANAHKYRDDRADTERVEPLTSDVRNAQDSQTHQTENKTAAEDTLSVQPISQEQGKNLDLYAVSPNYKPMKRIEVQPAKPFVRDPDDNSWRNESISSLGIVFKPKNSSKSFTQVLKNKTENVLSSLTDRDSKNGVPDLRERLGKIAEVRKSKKKRINKFGDTVYTDYEETSGSGESYTTPKSNTILSESLFTKMITTTPSVNTEHGTTHGHKTSEMADKDKKTPETITTLIAEILKQSDPDTLTTPKAKKVFNIAEYYDTTDEYDADYLTLSKIDLKKFTVPIQETTVSPPTESIPAKQMSPYPPDRKPTIQYFPPRVVPKVSVHVYDDNFNRKVNQYTLKETPKTSAGPTYKPVTLEPSLHEKERHKETIVKPKMPPPVSSFNINKNVYVSSAPPLPEQPQGFVANNGDYNRASYVIKHYGDFINEAAKDDDDRNSDYVVLTEPPIRGITVDELAKLPTAKPVTIDDDYDYETQFRKDILNRFVENFNQNSERFKVDFPVLYNNSIVHRKVYDNGRGVASSSAFMKRLYNDEATNRPNYLIMKKSCEPNCDNMTVELSPAYELHYYVPDQEEKEIMDPRVSAAQYRLRR